MMCYSPEGVCVCVCCRDSHAENRCVTSLTYMITNTYTQLRSRIVCVCVCVCVCVLIAD